MSTAKDGFVRDPEATASMPADDFVGMRETMVQTQIAARGVRDPMVLNAMRTVPREAFVPERLRPFAYEDGPLPIGEEQTISQPYIVAAMTEAAQPKPGDRVLEIGTGSGYGAAVLARIAAEVYTVERIASLAESSRRRLGELGYRNVHVLLGDGTLGWPEHAPYDAIVVTAGGPKVPRALLDQLAVGGRLVMPVGLECRFQRLVRVVRRGADDYDYEELEAVAFVRLIGAEGWPEPLPTAGAVSLPD
jgi:protein-L-isoaspartate(D-aspartate) O-methyltransferase